MKTLEERLEQIAIGINGHGEDIKKISASLERIAAALEASTASVIGTRSTSTDAPAPAPVKEKVTKKEKPAPVVPEAAPAIGDLSAGTAAPEYTQEDVAAALRNTIAKEGGKQTKAIELMVKHGANKAKPLVKDVKPENYAALIADVAAFIGA